MTPFPLTDLLLWLTSPPNMNGWWSVYDGHRASSITRSATVRASSDEFR